jgi:hypothetical protein
VTAAGRGAAWTPALTFRSSSPVVPSPAEGLPNARPQEILVHAPAPAASCSRSAEIVGAPAGETLITSGVTLYTVRNGEIDAGRFIPLGFEARR